MVLNHSVETQIDGCSTRWDYSVLLISTYSFWLVNRCINSLSSSSAPDCSLLWRRLLFLTFPLVIVHTRLCWIDVSWLHVNAWSSVTYFWRGKSRTENRHVKLKLNVELIIYFLCAQLCFILTVICPRRLAAASTARTLNAQSFLTFRRSACQSSDVLPSQDDDWLKVIFVFVGSWSVITSCYGHVVE